METLSDKQYTSAQAQGWTKQISDTIKDKLKGRINVVWIYTQKRIDVALPSSDLNLDRYKYAVQVVIGEQRGEGVK